MTAFSTLCIFNNLKLLDITLDHPPDGYAENDRLGTTGRNIDGSYGTNIYQELIQIGRKIRGLVLSKIKLRNLAWFLFNFFINVFFSLNITEKAFNEMGITDDVCKRRFVCEANYNARQNTFLETGFNILR